MDPVFPGNSGNNNPRYSFSMSSSPSNSLCQSPDRSSPMQSLFSSPTCSSRGGGYSPEYSSEASLSSSPERSPPGARDEDSPMRLRLLRAARIGGAGASGFVPIMMAPDEARGRPEDGAEEEMVGYSPVERYSDDVS